MLRKLASYLLLSFLSFSVATTLFHTVANAEESAAITAPQTTPAPTPYIIPTVTPTILPSTIKFKLQSVNVPTPTETPMPAQAINEVKAAQRKQAQEVAKTVATPTPTIVPTAIPTAIPSPTATPQPKPAIVAPSDLDPLFEKYAGEYGIDKEDLKRIAKCEAGFNPNAGNGPYVGMYQFMEQTWTSTRNQMGLDPNPDLRRNAEESIKTAAFKIKNGGRSSWPNC